MWRDREVKVHRGREALLAGRSDLPVAEPCLFGETWNLLTGHGASELRGP